MADDNKNLSGDTERTSILPQSEGVFNCLCIRHFV